MKFVAISDSHGEHHDIELPEGDVIVHAGDITNKGTQKEVECFLQWFSSLNYQHKIFIPGNHDFFLDETDPAIIKELIPDNVTYLNDSGVTINNVKIWGSPVQPCYYNMAFNRQRGDEIKRHWDLVPHDIDILITHGPAFGILDKNSNDECCGCEDLLQRILAIKPKVCIFGHIHEASGMEVKDNIKFINACVVDKAYNLQQTIPCFNYPE